LAFIPIDCCLQAARELHDCFGDLLKEYKVKDSENGIVEIEKSPTLSVGIAIGHSMEPLEDLLSFGKEAEKAAKSGKTAKDDRDGLAVHIYPRSGAPIKIRAQWKSKSEKGLDERLLKWAEMHCNDEMPDSAAYGIYELAEDYKNWDLSSEDETDKLRSLIAADIVRLLRRKKGSGNIEPLKKEEIEALLKGADPYEAVRRLADEMILARRLAAAMKQAKGKNCGKIQAQEVAS
jgi:CRISPR-associated protein Cmr2